MSTDAEMAIYGKAAIYLRKPERERLEAQAAPFDSKNACYVPDVKELYLKGMVVKRDGAKWDVKVLITEEVRGYLARNEKTIWWTCFCTSIFCSYSY